MKGFDVSSVLGADFVGPKSSQKEQIHTKIEVTCFDESNYVTLFYRRVRDNFNTLKTKSTKLVMINNGHNENIKCVFLFSTIQLRKAQTGVLLRIGKTVQK